MREKEKARSGKEKEFKVGECAQVTLLHIHEGDRQHQNKKKSGFYFIFIMHFPLHS